VSRESQASREAPDAAPRFGAIRPTLAVSAPEGLRGRPNFAHASAFHRVRFRAWIASCNRVNSLDAFRGLVVSDSRIFSEFMVEAIMCLRISPNQNFFSYERAHGPGNRHYDEWR
jgi:hypothetical protein